MKVIIDLKHALEHKDHVDNIINKLRRGRSRHKDAEASELIWHYDYVTMINACSVNDLLAGNVTKIPDTVEERVAEELERVVVRLAASIGHWHGVSDQPLHSVPLPIRSLIHDKHVEMKREEDRVAALSPEEREHETASILDRLRGGSFIELKRKS